MTFWSIIDQATSEVSGSSDHYWSSYDSASEHPIFKRFSTSHVGVLYQYLLYELIHHSSSCFLSKATGMGKSKYKWGNMHWDWILILITIEVITIGTQIFIENIICVNCLSELFNQVVICSRHDWKFTYVVVCMRKFLGWSNLEFRVWSRRTISYHVQNTFVLED